MTTTEMADRRVVSRVIHRKLGYRVSGHVGGMPYAAAVGALARLARGDEAYRPAAEMAASSLGVPLEELLEPLRRWLG